MEEILKIFHGAVNVPQEQKLAVLNEQFCQMAKELLYGGYFCIEGKNQIYLDDIEFYYHEEGEGGLKDPIMYHTNDHEGREIPYFEMGRLNLHTSGVDVMFENEEKQYRASFLIRGFHVEGGEYDSHSTHIYDKMLYMGLPLGKPIEIEWIALRLPGYENYEPKGEPRQNVAEYEKDEKGRFVKKPAIGVFDEKKHFHYGKNNYVRCLRPWRFKKEIRK